MENLKNIIKSKLTFIKYIISAGISFILDMTLFTIFSFFLMPFIGDSSILASTVLARVISSFINYLMNKNKVFNTEKNNKKIDKETFVKYFILVVIQMFVSAGTVYLLFKVTKINQTVIKFPVDIMIFIVNYFIQKLFIFNKKK